MRMAVYGITAHGFVKHVSEFWKTFLNTYVKICLILKKNVFSQLSVHPVGTIGLRGEDTRSFLRQKRFACFQIFCENPVFERLLRSIYLSFYGCRSTILEKNEKLEKISKNRCFCTKFGLNKVIFIFIFRKF